MRKVFHAIGGSFFPILFIFFPEDICFLLLYIALGFFFLFDASRLFIPPLNRFLFSKYGFMFKDVERRRPTGSTVLLIASLVVFTFFPREIAITSLLFLSIGDPVSWLARKKPLMGAIMLVTCLLVGFLIKFTLFPLSITAVILGAVGASLGQLLPFPDDNFLIPALSALLMWSVS